MFFFSLKQKKSDIYICYRMYRMTSEIVFLLQAPGDQLRDQRKFDDVCVCDVSIFYQLDDDAHGFLLFCSSSL